MIPILRADAKTKILAHWQPVIDLAGERRCSVHIPGWDRLRNYEYETILDRVFGGPFVIGEWCPFDGIWCAWRDEAPPSVLRETIAWWRDGRKALEGSFNVDYHLDKLETSLRDALARGAT